MYWVFFSWAPPFQSILWTRRWITIIIFILLSENKNKEFIFTPLPFRVPIWYCDYSYGFVTIHGTALWIPIWYCDKSCGIVTTHMVLWQPIITCFSACLSKSVGWFEWNLQSVSLLCVLVYPIWHCDVSYSIVTTNVVSWLLKCHYNSYGILTSHMIYWQVLWYYVLARFQRSLRWYSYGCRLMYMPCSRVLM